MSSRRSSRSSGAGSSVPPNPPNSPNLPQLPGSPESLGHQGSMETTRLGLIANLPKTPKTPKRRNSTPLQSTTPYLDPDMALDLPLTPSHQRPLDTLIESGSRRAHATPSDSDSESGTSSQRPTQIETKTKTKTKTTTKTTAGTESDCGCDSTSPSTKPLSSNRLAESPSQLADQNLESTRASPDDDDIEDEDDIPDETPSISPVPPEVQVTTRSKPPTPRRIPQMPNLPTVRQTLANLPSTRSKGRSSTRVTGSPNDLPASRPLTDLNQSPSSTRVDTHDGLAGPSIPVSVIDLGPGSDSVDQVLSKHGYHVLSKVLVKDDEHESIHARFLDVLNNLGQRVFVELDIEGRVAAQPQDPIMIPGSTRANQLPHSCKIGTFECAGQEVAGVVFAHVDDVGKHHDICSLLRDEDGSGPLEVNYHLDSDTAEIMTKPIAYPIVRLSEIVDNPDLTQRNINEATRRIRNTTYENCKTEIEHTRDAIRKLGETFTEFNDVQSRCSHELMASIRSLEKIHQQYREFPPTTDENRDRYRKLLFNFRKRHEFAIELIGVCQLVNAQRDTILQYTQLIREALDYCRKEFRDINRVIDD
jgi:hypothetical protein